MIAQSRKRLLTWFRPAWIKDDSGVAALVIAAVIAFAAFTTLTIFLNKFIGGRELAKAQSGAAAQGRMLPAVYSFFLADQGAGAPNRLPCPDIAATPTGHESAAGCSTAGTNYIGVIPWADLGLSRDDVIDGYGNFYTYVVSGTASGMCESITKNYVPSGGSAQEFTGRAVTSTLEARLTTEIAGTGRKVPFAIIGHGLNGTGALSSAGHVTATPAKAGEQGNAASVNNASPPNAIFTGPADPDTASTTYFDDHVLAPAAADIQKVCAQLTPGGDINASVADSLASGTATAANFGNVSAGGVGTNRVTVQGSTSDATNKVAAFAVTVSGGSAATSYLVTNSTNFNFDPLARAVYTKATWRAGANSATFSIATRGSAADLTAGSDLFDAGSSNGLTFRFGATLEIRNGAASQLATGTGLTITTGTLYTLEVYDNGSDVWMRISPTASPSTSATISATNITVDTAGDQQVFFINSSTAATAEIDDITVGLPMLAAQTSGAITSYLTASGVDTASGRVTLEAWVRPRTLPSSGNNATILAKWNTNDPANSSFRLRINSVGKVYLDVASDGASTVIESFAGPSLTANMWSHIAVSYTFNNTADDNPVAPATAVADTETVAFYKNGDLISSVTQAVTGTTVLGVSAAGVHHASVPDFYVGADLNNTTVADPFAGEIADVRVWDAARTALEVYTYFQSRLSAALPIPRSMI